MKIILKTIRKRKMYLDYIEARFSNNRLVKKAGDDKLVISLILIAVGVVLCFLYRNQIMSVLSKALVTLDDKVKAMFDSTAPLGTPDTDGYTTP
jgi:hypothetical protein